MTLRSTLSTTDGKRRYVRRLFATIADRYDVVTRVLSYGQDQRWKRRLMSLAAIRPADRVLDLACGTGDLLLAAADRARVAVGLDVTHRMLQLAAARRRECPDPRSRSLDPAWFALVAGDMIALPFRDGRFDVITTGYGLRNVPDLGAAVSEIHRVLAPDGRFFSLDFNRPANGLVRAAYLAYLTVAGSALGAILHRDADTYRYIPESIRLYPGSVEVGRILANAGFTDVRIVPLLGGLMAIHTARKPD